MGTPHDEADFSNSLVGRMGVSPNDEKVKIDVYIVHGKNTNRMFACSKKPLANLFGSGHPEDEADAAQLWAQTLSQAYRF